MRLSYLLVAPLVLAALTGCTRDGKFQPVDMWNGSRLKPYENINFFDDKRSSRTPPVGTIARGQDRLNEPVFYGTKNGTLITNNPVMDLAKTPEDKLAVVERGQERYQIYCQPCHGLAGYGDGMIVKRGFAKPPTYHQERLRNVSDGYLYDVIANGYGSMYSYGARVPTRDRWAIVAYIRALQRSQNSTASEMPKELDPKNPEAEIVTPAIQPGEQKYMGPGAGREYHGTGPQGSSQGTSADSTNRAHEERGMNDTGQVRP